MTFIALQFLLGKIKSRAAHQRRNRDLNPLLTIAFPVGAATIAVSTSLPEWPGDLFARTPLGFSKTSFTAVRRITQHSPHRCAFPARVPGSCRHLALIQ